MIQIQFDNTQIGTTLADLLRRLGDLEPIMVAIGGELESRVASRFETRSDPLGQPWAPWSPSTASAYPDDGRGQVLERYGDMLGSLGWQADGASVQVGFAAASKEGDVYANYHEFGSQHMPRRGLLAADPDAGTLAADDVAAIEAILSDYLSI